MTRKAARAAGKHDPDVEALKLSADALAGIKFNPEVELRTLTDLVANPTNPREPWKAEQVAPFLASLKRFGDLGGIVRNVSTGQLVGGHKRVEAFHSAAAVEVVCTPQPEDAQGTVGHGYVLADGMRFSYREVRWPPDVEAAANLAANRWQADWDWQGVADALKQIDEGELRDLTGFPAHEIATLLAGDWSPATPSGSLPDGEGGGHVVKLTAEQYALLDLVRPQFPEAETDAALVEMMCQWLLTQPRS